METPSAEPGGILTGISQRQPPSNIFAEQALLGACLSNNRAYHAVSGFLTPLAFAESLHQWLFAQIGWRIDAGRVVDAVSLKDLENAPQWDAAGVKCSAYLAGLLTSMVAVGVAAEYGRAVHDCWVRRRLIGLGEAMVHNAFGADPESRPADQLDHAEDEISALRELATPGMAQRRGLTTIGEAFLAATERADAMASGRIARPYTTGLPAIDRMMGGGVGPDTLTYLIGAKAAGKTELSLQIAESVAVNVLTSWVAGGREGQCPGVLYIMLGNMTATQLGARTAARAAGMRLAPIRRGTIDLEQGERLVRATDVVSQLPLEISDSGPSTLGRVLGDMRRVARKRPLVLTIIDNFSDMLSVAADKMFATAIGITKALKEQGANATNSAVLLLMHLNSSVDNGSTKRSPRPRPSDIPWQTGKDADFAFGIWRPYLYLDPDKPQPPSKKMSTDGQEWYAKALAEWNDKREPWPKGVRDVTEAVPMKLREDDSDSAGEIGKLRFDRDRHAFVDVETEKPAGLTGMPAQDAPWDAVA